VAQIAQVTIVPGIWTMAQRDTREQPTRNADAITNSNVLAGRGIPTQYIVVAPRAVYPTRFTQIVGVSETDPRAICTAPRSTAALDGNDYLVKAPNDMTNLAGLVPPSLTRCASEVGSQLNIAYTAHQFSAATERRVLDFFSARFP